jgi:hypothetical protein
LMFTDKGFILSSFFKVILLSVKTPWWYYASDYINTSIFTKYIIIKECYLNI